MNKNFLLLIIFLPVIIFCQDKQYKIAVDKGDYCSCNYYDIKSQNRLDILVNNNNYLLINNELNTIDNLRTKVHEFLSNNGNDPRLSDNIQNAFIIISSRSERVFDYALITLIYNVYNRLNIPFSERKLCYFNYDEDTRGINIYATSATSTTSTTSTRSY